MEVFVEGLVPATRLEELTGAHVFYRERDHALVSGSGHGSRAAPRPSSKKAARGGSREQVWKLGDRLRVRAERIDPIRRRVEFAPLP
jgi:hypothetical protein